MSDYVCESLAKHHARTHFDCGVPVLNDYLAKYANQDMKRKAAAVFVMVERSSPQRVIGFYTLCATSVDLTSVPVELTKKLPRYPEIPAILLGRLARDTEFPGVGSLLLGDALSRCVRVGKDIAATLIVVDSKGKAATQFYERFGFISLPKMPERMFLPVQVAEKL
jgi:ribosomal protein S18 acetylase RimI-like enzyme